MSIYAHGSFTRSGGITSAIAKEMKLIKLSAVKKVEVNFDPFLANTNSTREFLYKITHALVRQTNSKCILKTNVLNKREEPNIQFSLITGDTVEFKTGNLSLLEVLKLYNRYITPHNPVIEEKKILQTKSTKKGLLKK